MADVQVDTFGLRINQDVCFTTHNNKLHMGTTKRQLKILRDVAPLLRQVLKPDEEILLAVRAASPMSWFEQLTTGWIIYLLKRCVLVFTNKRILHLPTTMNFKPKSSVAQVVYGDLTEAKVSGFMGRVLKLNYKTGKKEELQLCGVAGVQKTKGAAVDIAERRAAVGSEREASPLSEMPGATRERKVHLSQLPVTIQRRRAGDSIIGLLSRRRLLLYGPSGVGSRRCGYGRSSFGSVRRRVDRRADR